jgi:hypothetical protein
MSDFAAGYVPNEGYNSGPALSSLPGSIDPGEGCGLGRMPSVVSQDGSFSPGHDSADADAFYVKANPNPRSVQSLYLGQAIYQYASPAEAEAFFSAIRTCLIDNKPWSDGVDTAPVNGDQAVTADLISTPDDPSHNWKWSAEPLFVLHGTDVFALSAGSFPRTGPVTIPGAAELIAELIARVDALSPASSAVSSAAPSSVASAVSSPAVASRRQAAQDLAELLAQSGTDRAAITQAFSAVADCSPGLSQDETTFSTAASSRQALLAKLAALPDRSALPASMLQDLTTAWQASGQADQDLANWTRDEIAHGCSTDYRSDASYQASAGPDKQATTDKKAFAALWAAIANEYGLASYQYNQI